MSVFPKQSRHAVPTCYWKLYDPESPIIEFYPSEVKLDINGERYAWMGVNLLSFIDRPRLLEAMNEADRGGEALTQHEQERNKRFGDIRLFFRSHVHNSKSELVQMLLMDFKNFSEHHASFEKKDTITGHVKMGTKPNKHSSQIDINFGYTIKKQCGQLEVNVESCKCFILHFLHPKYAKHDC